MKIKISEHRSGWCNSLKNFDNKSLQNTEQGFRNSFTRGNGIETDLRNNGKTIVIAHNIDSINVNTLTFEKLLQIYNEYDRAGTLALNIKSDGLQPTAKILLEKYKITNYFFFDSSIPDHIGYIAHGLKSYIRHSELEPRPSKTNPMMYKSCQGVWLDQFYNPSNGLCLYANTLNSQIYKTNDGLSWITLEVMKEHLNANKNLALVSPELHLWGRNPETYLYKKIWNQWYSAFTKLKKDGYDLKKIHICTDLPELAEKYFHTSKEEN